MSAPGRLGARLRALPAPLRPAALRTESGTRAPEDRPRTALRTTASVPAWVLRLALLALGLGAGVVALAGEGQPWVAVAIAVVVAARPHGALLTIAVGLVAGMLGLYAQAWWQLPVLVLLTHALLRLGALADAVSWRGRVELGVLRDALPAFVAVQVTGQVAALLALLLDGAAPMPWLVVVAVGGLGVLTWVLAGQVRPD